jgi:hypothetical protein
VEPALTIEAAAVPSPEDHEGERSNALLAHFLQRNPGARQAARSLRPGAEVALAFTDVPGTWRAFLDGAGSIGFEQRAAADADFALLIPPQALRELRAANAGELGDLGVAFLELMASSDPERRIHATAHSGMIKLARRGWLALLAQGGTRVAAWLGREGVRGPGTIAAALARLRPRTIAPARIRR